MVDSFGCTSSFSIQSNFKSSILINIELDKGLRRGKEPQAKRNGISFPLIYERST